MSFTDLEFVKTVPYVLLIANVLIYLADRFYKERGLSPLLKKDILYLESA